jgi:hypothetical protein
VTDVEVRVTQYEVSAVPEGNIDYPHFVVRVERRGADKWAAVRHQQCLSASGEWSVELRSSSREDEWLTEHRFDLDTALRMAQDAALKVTVNGWTVQKALGQTGRET